MPVKSSSEINKILIGIGSFVLLSAVSFFGATLLKSIDQVKEDTIEIKLIKKDVTNIIKDLENIQATTAVLLPSQNKMISDIEIIKAKIDMMEGR